MAAARARGPSEATRRWWILAGCCAGLFLLMLDSTIVTLALPAIQRDLDASAPELQWVVNAYLLAIAALVVTAGRLGDLFGRKRVYLAGLAVFAAGAVVSALADSPVAMIAGRVVQGAGAAPALGLSLALASNAFGEDERPRALGLWAGVSAAALAVGPLLGGVLVDTLSWRWVFWLALPFAAVGIGVTWWAATDARDETAKARIDWPGLALLTLSLVAVVLAIVQADDWGWGSAATLGLLGAGLAGLAGFVAVERRARQPIVDLALFRNRPYLGASAAAFALVGAWWTVIYYQPQYLQAILGHSPVVAGLMVLPITLPMMFISPAAGRLIGALGVRRTMVAGMLCGTAAALLLTRVDATTTYGDLLPGYLIFGVALGLVYAPMSTAAMEAMPREKAGIAAGVLAMNRVLAGALMLAVAGAVFVAIERGAAERAAATTTTVAIQRRDLDGLLAGRPTAEGAVARLPAGERSEVRADARRAYAGGIAGSAWVLVGLMALGTGLTWWLLAPAPTTRPATAARVLPLDEHHLHHRRFHM